MVLCVVVTKEPKIPKRACCDLSMMPVELCSL